MKQSELQQILEEHKLWLEGNPQGNKADLQRANLRGADLQNANLQEADLRSAYLRGADLQGACLRGADLQGAYLRGADLQGAYLYNTEIYTFQFGKHFAFAHFGNQYKGGSLVQVGCHEHSLDYWLEHYVKIGEENDYTSIEIEIYGIQLRALAEIASKLKESNQ